METCYSLNESPFNKEQSNPNLELVANMVTELWLFFTGMYDYCVITLIDWQEMPLGYSVSYVLHVK